MKKTTIIILLFISILNINAQEVLEGVYVREISKYIPKYNSILHKVTFQLNNQITGKENFTIFLSNEIPDMWYPVISSGIIDNYIPDTVKLNFDILTKPIKNKVFENLVFFNPLADLNKSSQDTANYIKRQALIRSTRFYIDSSYMIDTSNIAVDPSRSVGYNLKKDRIEFLRPFYFKKFEVTNAEYREFTDWVRDSSAMELLIAAGFNEYKICNKNGSYLLNWKLRNTIWLTENEDKYEALSPIYQVQHERFYQTKIVDAEKIIFQGIPVYPDTLVWLSTDIYNYNESLSKTYFWHKDFNNYPVVGVSWNQAKAYCQWKTKMIQNEFDKAKLPYRIEVELPAEYEREYVLTGYSPSKTNRTFDKSYIPALIIKEDYPKFYFGENILWNYSGIFDKNGYKQTHPADISKIQIKKTESNFPDKRELLSDIDDNGISGLKSNVSEWMKENYQENWLSVMKMRNKLYHSINYLEFRKKLAEFDSTSLSKKDFEFLKNNINTLENCYTSIYPIQYLLEQEIDKTNDKNGKLVRGSNWFDETFERVYIENAKIFISPEKSFSTVGFRYVIHVYTKN